MRTYAIGDLHGRLDVLNAVYDKIEAHSSDPYTLVITGDFVDRGPNSAGIIRWLMRKQKITAEGGNMNLVVLKGNHEDMMLQCIRKVQLPWWLGNGGGQTLESYGYKTGDALLPLKIPQEHLDWLDQLPIFYHDTYRIFVHAGFQPDIPLDYQLPQEMMWRYDPNETDYSFEGRHVVCGHVQHADGPILTANRSNMDTYAWKTGRQAIAVFDDNIRGGPVEILEVQCEPHESWVDIS